MKEYIGFLDSGVGGLSVLKEVYKLLPYANYIYFGDTKNIPYGTKTPDEIFSFTKEIFSFLLSKGAKTVVIACNTTSAVAYNRLKEVFKNKINIFPLIQTTAPYALNGLNDNDTIAVLATRATVNSKKYSEILKTINPKINVLELDCTGFVEIVENRLYDDKNSIELIKSKLDIVKKAGVKRVILGCTHYPYLEDIFKSIYNTCYFNPAKRLAQIVKNSIISTNKEGEMLFYTSKNPLEFIKSAQTFFDIKQAKEINPGALV